MALARRLSDRLTTCLSRRFLVEWRTAVMSVGGFLGLAHNHYPIPWSALKYDTALQGYRTGVTEGQLKAPEFSDDFWTDRDWEARIHQHYGAPAYWGA